MLKVLGPLRSLWALIRDGSHLSWLLLVGTFRFEFPLGTIWCVRQHLSPRTSQWLCSPPHPHRNTATVLSGHWVAQSHCSNGSSLKKYDQLTLPRWLIPSLSCFVMQAFVCSHLKTLSPFHQSSTFYRFAFLSQSWKSFSAAWDRSSLRRISGKSLANLQGYCICSGLLHYSFDICIWHLNFEGASLLSDYKKKQNIQKNY